MEEKREGSFDRLIDIIKDESILPQYPVDKEKEIAQKILKDLVGIPVIRATSILKFCLKAIQYTKYD